MEGRQNIWLESASHFCSALEKMVTLLLETGDAYGVVTVGENKFVQVMALDEGALRIESSDSDKVLAANLGFDEIVDEYDHIAATHVAPGHPAKEKHAAETLTLLATRVHEVKFPASLEFHLDVNDYALNT